jgi:hypothetical protein
MLCERHLIAPSCTAVHHGCIMAALHHQLQGGSHTNHIPAACHMTALFFCCCCDRLLPCTAPPTQIALHHAALLGRTAPLSSTHGIPLHLVALYGTLRHCNTYGILPHYIALHNKNQHQPLKPQILNLNQTLFQTLTQTTLHQQHHQQHHQQQHHLPAAAAAAELPRHQQLQHPHLRQVVQHLNRQPLVQAQLAAKPQVEAPLNPHRLKPHQQHLVFLRVLKLVEAAAVSDKSNLSK